MRVLQGTLTVFAVIVIAVSFMNPGGFLLALTIGAILVVVAVVVPFLKEYFIAASRGKYAKSSQHDGRRRDE